MGMETAIIKQTPADQVTIERKDASGKPFKKNWSHMPNGEDASGKPFKKNWSHMPELVILLCLLSNSRLDVQIEEHQCIKFKHGLKEDQANAFQGLHYT